MSPIVKIFGALRYIAYHPINRSRKFKAMIDFSVAQVSARLFPGEVCVTFPNDTQLMIPPRMKGAMHFISPKLYDFEEMSFVLHLLRPGDLFVDVGANIGAYTVLAAGAVGANVTAFEPNPTIYPTLEKNVRLNALSERVNTVNAALGRASGNLKFTVDLGTESSVAVAGDASNIISVPVLSLDEQLAGQTPFMIKIDVEGFEAEVLAGAINILRQNSCAALLIERVGLGARYGFDEAKLHKMIQLSGFTPCNYDPLERKLVILNPDATGNIIYIRNLAQATARLKSAPRFRLDTFSA